MSMSPFRGVYPKLAMAGLGLFVLGPLLAMLDLVVGFNAFLVTITGAGLGAIAAVGGVVYLFKRARRPGYFSLFVGLVPVLVFAISGLSLGMGKYPRINDITTDLVDPPALSNGAAYPSDFAPIEREHYPDIQTLRFDTAPTAVFAAALDLATTHDGWEVTAHDAAQGWIHGVAVSSIFHFKDDFAIRIRPAPDAPDGAVVDMRSRSRSGKGDFGTNAARVREYLASLRAALPGT